MCSADIAEAAEAPDGAADTDGLAVESPETGSAFDEGHKPLLPGFLRTPFSPLGKPFGWLAGEEIVDADELEEVDDKDEEELLRCTFFRGTKMRETSSGVILRLFPLWGQPLRGRPFGKLVV